MANWPFDPITMRFLKWLAMCVEDVVRWFLESGRFLKTKAVLFSTEVQRDAKRLLHQAALT